jgi:hypothetical protein
MISIDAGTDGVSERDMLVGLISGLYTSIATRWPVDGTRMTSTDALKGTSFETSYLAVDFSRVYEQCTDV